LFVKAGFRNESQFKGNIGAARRYGESFDGRRKIFVWSEEDVNKLLHKVGFKTE